MSSSRQFVKVVYDQEEFEPDYGWHLVKNQIKLFDSIDNYHKFIDSSFNVNKFKLISVVFGDIINIKNVDDVLDEYVKSCKRIDDNEKAQEERERQEKIKKLQKELEELQNKGK